MRPSNTPERRRQYSRDAWAKFTALVREAKNKPCADCGQRFPFYVMEFDHRPEETKHFSLGKRGTRGRQKVLDEIAKCDVVCANCHHIRSYQRIQARNSEAE